MLRLHDLPYDIFEMLLLENGILHSLSLTCKDLYYKVKLIKESYENIYDGYYKKWRYNVRPLVEKISCIGNLNKLIFLYKNYKYKINNIWIIKNAAINNNYNIISWAINNLNLNADDYNCIIENSIKYNNNIYNKLNIMFNDKKYIWMAKIASQNNNFDIIIWCISNIKNIDNIKIIRIIVICVNILNDCNIKLLLDFVFDNFKFNNDEYIYIVGILSKRNEEIFKSYVTKINSIYYYDLIKYISSYGNIRNFLYIYNNIERTNSILNNIAKYSCYSKNNEILMYILNIESEIDYKNIAIYASISGNIEAIKNILEKTDINIDIISVYASFYNNYSLVQWLINNYTNLDYNTMLLNAIHTGSITIVNYLLNYMNKNNIDTNIDLLLKQSKIRNYKKINNRIIEFNKRYKSL